MNEPLVSAIINNYNYGRFLRESIGSALSQTYRNNEVIVVDDGSTDCSREVIEGYGGAVVPVFKENGGQASAFNAGFAVSRGSIICFLDSDDVWLPDKVEKVVGAALENPNAALIYHRYRRLIDGAAAGPALPKRLYRGPIGERLARSGGWWHCPPTSALSFKRGYLAKAMDVPEKRFRLAADAYLGSLVPFIGEVYGLDGCLALYRIHGSNMGYQNNPAMRKGDRDAFRIALGNYENCAAGVNQGLKRLGIGRRVSAQDIWGYKRLKWKLGLGPSVFSLSWACLTFAGETVVTDRIKNAARLWMDFLGIRRPPERRRAGA